MGYYLDSDEHYYEGIRKLEQDISVKKRPTEFHIYKSGKWVINSEAIDYRKSYQEIDNIITHSFQKELEFQEEILKMKEKILEINVTDIEHKSFNTLNEVMGRIYA